MRISSNPSDPGYSMWHSMRKRGLTVDIAVDGRPVKGCVTVDTKRRLVVMHDRDGKGKLQLNARRDAVKLRQLSGDVAVQIRRG